MRILHEEYSDSFTKECKSLFGLEPKTIKEIISVLAVHNCLDVKRLSEDLTDLEESKKKIAEAIRYTAHMTSIVEKDYIKNSGTDSNGSRKLSAF